MVIRTLAFSDESSGMMCIEESTVRSRNCAGSSSRDRTPPEQLGGCHGQTENVYGAAHPGSVVLR